MLARVGQGWGAQDSARKNREALVGIGKCKAAIATVRQRWETLGKDAGIKNGAQMKRKSSKRWKAKQRQQNKKKPSG